MIDRYTPPAECPFCPAVVMDYEGEDGWTLECPQCDYSEGGDWLGWWASFRGHSFSAEYDDVEYSDRIDRHVNIAIYRHGGDPKWVRWRYYTHNTRQGMMPVDIPF